MKVEGIAAKGRSQMYLFGGLDDGHKLLKFHIFSKQTSTGHFVMAGSLRRPGQMLLTGLKEVQLFKKDLEMKKNW